MFGGVLALLGGSPLLAFLVLLLAAYVLAAHLLTPGPRAALAAYLCATSFVALIVVLVAARGLAGAAANAIVDPVLASEFRAPELDIEFPSPPPLPDIDFFDFEFPTPPPFPPDLEFPTTPPLPTPIPFEFEPPPRPQPFPPQGLTPRVRAAAQTVELTGRDTAPAEYARWGILLLVAGGVLWLHAVKARDLLDEEAE
jgi:hypothetical protein